jgi:DNA polymerase-3 subunit gamma/tau
LLEHFRNLAVLKVSGGRLLPEIPDEEAESLKKQMERIGTEDCDRAFRVLQETDEEVGRSPYPKLVLEMALIKLATLPGLLPLDDLMTRMEELEARLRRSPAAPPGAASQPRQTSRDAAPPPRSTPGKVAASPRAGAAVARAQRATPVEVASGTGGWRDFVDFVRSERPTLADHLGTCEMSRMEGSVLEIEAPTGFRHDYLTRRDHVAEVEDLVGRFFQRPLRVVVSPGKAKKAAAEIQASDAAASTADLTTAALGDPVVRAAVEILGGEVAEVRPRRSRRREEE